MGRMQNWSDDIKNKQPCELQVCTNGLSESYKFEIDRPRAVAMKGPHNCSGYRVTCPGRGQESYAMCDKLYPNTLQKW